MVTLSHDDHNVLEEVKQLVQASQIILLYLAGLEIDTALSFLLKPLLHCGKDLSYCHL